MLLSIVSSFRDRALAEGTLSFGEVGLAGEVRPVRFGTERLTEAAKQGFRRAIIPANNVPRRSPDGLEILPVEDLDTALELAFE